MSLKTTLRLIHSDYRRYRRTGAPTFFHVVFFTQGFWASTAYRLSHWVRSDVHIPVVRQLLSLYFLILLKLTEIFAGIHLPSDCEVGEGLYIGHYGPTVVNGMVRIGKNCNLSHSVTIGYKQRGSRQGAPVLGDRVYIGPNSVLVGDIHIGDDVAIGAGSIVVKSVPDRAVVAGNPAQVLSYAGSFEMISYDRMEQDPARNQSLAAAKKKPESGSES